MRKRILLLGTLGFVGWTSFGIAAEAPNEREAFLGDPVALPVEWNLDQLKTLAVEHNPTIRQAREKVAEWHGVHIATLSAGLPELEASGEYTQQDPGLIESFGPDGFQPDDVTWKTGLQLNMTVYSAGRLSARLEAEDHRYQAIRSAIRSTVHDVLLEVSEAWLAAELAQEQRSVQDEAFKVLDQQVVWTAHRVEAGAANKLALLQAKVARENVRPAQLRAGNDYRLAIDRLRRLVGLPLGEAVALEQIRLKPMADKQPPVPPLKKALARAQVRRPELAESNRLLDAAYAELRLAQKGNKPTVGIFGGYGYHGTQFSDASYLDGWNAGVQAKWSLWDGGLTKGRVKEAESMIRQQVLARNGLRSKIQGDVRAAWYNWQVATEIGKTTEATIAQAEEAYRLAKARQEAGGATQLDVLQSQLEVTRAQLESVTARHDVRLAQARLRHATGLLP